MTSMEPLSDSAANRLPRIEHFNVATYPPPDLGKCRSAASRTAGSEPALWYKQMTGEDWAGDGHSYDVARKRWRRMEACMEDTTSYAKRERVRESKRDRSGRAKSNSKATKEERRIAKAEYRKDPHVRRRRLEQLEEARVQRAQRAQQRKQEAADSKARWEASLQREQRCADHLVHLLTVAGVEHAWMFKSSALRRDEFAACIIQEVSQFAKWARDDEPDLTPEDFTRRLLGYLGAYCDAMYEHDEMLEKTEIGRKLKDGGAVDPPVIGALVRQRVLPAFFVIGPDFPVTRDIAAEDAWLARRECHLGSRLTREMTWWPTQEALFGRWQNTRLSLDECERVCVVCKEWLVRCSGRGRGRR